MLFNSAYNLRPVGVKCYLIGFLLFGGISK